MDLQIRFLEKDDYNHKFKQLIPYEAPDNVNTGQTVQKAIDNIVKDQS